MRLSTDASEWTKEEDDAILKAHGEMGNKWAKIAKEVDTRRTDNAIKNRWNKNLKYKAEKAQRRSA